MAALGNTVVAPLCAPTQLLFDSVDDLSELYMSKTWTASIKFRCLPISKLMIGLPLDKNGIQVVDICDYLGSSLSNLSVVRLYLDPYKFDKLPVDGEPLSKNLHWMQLKDHVEAAFTPLDRPSCAMAEMLIVDSNARSFATVSTSLGFQRRMMHPGKMIAST
jgi:hypothetical protein